MARAKPNLMKEVVDALAEKVVCPQGHVLPHEKCTRKKCRDAPALAMDPSLKDEMKAVADEETRALALSGARSSAILKALGIPQGLVGADAEEWCNAKLAEMRVTALALQDYLMKHGTPSQSARASEKILEITEKQGQIASVAPIIIINGQGGAAIPPWRREVVEGEVVNGKAMDNVAAVQAPAGPSKTSG